MCTQRKLQRLPTSPHQPLVEGCSRAGPRTPYILHTRHAALLIPAPAAPTVTLILLLRPTAQWTQAEVHMNWQLEVQPVFMEMTDAKGLW